MRNKGIVVVLAILLCTAPSAAMAGNGYSDGQAAAASLNSQLDSSDKIQNRLSQPLTSSGTPMRTFGPDGETQTFNAQLTAPSSESFLDIFAQPGGTGDLVTLIVKQDTDFDGNFDTVFNLPVAISGICANGIISCTPGTWNNCHHYSWRAESNLKINIKSLPGIKELGGCFCINSSCGSNLPWSNMEYILSTLGTGIVAAIQDSNPQVVITGVDTTMTYAKYYGQRVTTIGSALASNSGVYFSGTAHPEEYYAAGDISIDDEVMSQSANPDSPYNMVLGSFSARQNPREEKTCVIQRSVEFNDADQPYVETVETCSSLNLTNCSLYKESICDYNNSNCVQSYSNGSGTGLLPVSNMISLNSPQGAAWTFDTNGSAITSARTDVTPNQSGVLTSGTSLWWIVQRQYFCDTGVVIDPSAANARATSVGESTKLNGNVMTYKDYGTQYDVVLPILDAPEPCEKGCKVSKPITRTDVGEEGGTWDFQKNVNSTQITYKTCIDNACPIESGETIITNCTCLNALTEAVSIMNTMHEAGADMICSTN